MCKTSYNMLSYYYILFICNFEIINLKHSNFRKILFNIVLFIPLKIFNELETGKVQ
jgi:hypothetical protein